MTIDETEVDEYGYPTEAARAHVQMRRQDRTAHVRRQPGLQGSEPSYAVFGTRHGKTVQLSLEMPNEGTAWINANSQRGHKVGS
jgi:hypothetical protein